jgi:L-ribulose-5-phosphate 3-epimerase
MNDKVIFSRRMFLSAAGITCVHAVPPQALKIGVIDGVLRQAGKPEAVALAGHIGLEGLQVTITESADGSQLLLEEPELQAKYLEESAKYGVRIDATYLAALQANCLKNDARGRNWVLKGIEITRRLQAGIMMIAMYAKCSVATQQEQNYIAEAFKELAPEAEKAGVVLGLENLLSTEDTVRIVDRSSSRALKIYYDVGIATNTFGANAAQEIRWLTKDRICQFHLKDVGYLGEGRVNCEAVLEAIADIGFEGYANLETSSPSGSVEADMRRNLSYLRGLMRE